MMDSSVESAMAPMEDSMTGEDQDQDGADPEEFSGKGASSEAHPEGYAGADDEDDEDDDDDDGVQVTIGTINSSPATGGAPNFNRRFSKGGGAAKVATPVAAAENGSEVMEKQKTTIDIEAEGSINGMPVKEFDLDSILDKPWRKPGADITDYFNYGFNELTWKAYCTKQQSLRVSNGLPAIGHPNFAPDKRSGINSSLIDTQTGRGAGGGGGGGFQKKPLVIDMAKIREKFNILGDRGGAVATQQQQPPPRRMDFNKPSDSGTSSIAVIGGSDSTSRRIPSQESSGPLGIPTIGGGGSSLSKPPAPSPFMPGLDMSRPPPGFPLGAMPAGPPPVGVPIPSFPPQVAAPSGGPPPTGGPPPFGAPPFGDLFAGASAPPNAAPSPFPPQMPPMSGPPGSSAMPPAGWGAPAMPPAGPPPAGFGGPAVAANAMPAALQRSASPTPFCRLGPDLM